MVTARRNYYTAKQQTDAAKRHMLSDFNTANANKNYATYSGNYDRQQANKKAYTRAKASYHVHSAIHKVTSIASKKPNSKHASSGKKKFQSLFNKLKNRKN